MTSESILLSCSVIVSISCSLGSKLGESSILNNGSEFLPSRIFAASLISFCSCVRRAPSFLVKSRTAPETSFVSSFFVSAKALILSPVSSIDSMPVTTKPSSTFCSSTSKPCRAISFGGFVGYCFLPLSPMVL